MFIFINIYAGDIRVNVDKFTFLLFCNYALIIIFVENVTLKFLETPNLGVNGLKHKII